jgi:dUTP pyrophosphatase
MTCENLLIGFSFLFGVCLASIGFFKNWFKNTPKKLKVRFLTNKVPQETLTRGSYYSAGLDLCSAYQYTIPPQSRVLVNTDISIRVPYSTYGRIAPRSGLAKNYGIDVLAGVIDHDYTGPVGVILINTDTTTSFEVKPGDRVAQLILEKYEPNIEIKLKEFLPETSRGESGFGSTGTNNLESVN